MADEVWPGESLILSCLHIDPQPRGWRRMVDYPDVSDVCIQITATHTGKVGALQRIALRLMSFCPGLVPILAPIHLVSKMN